MATLSFFAIRRPSTILDLLCASSDHPGRVSGGLYRCAKIRWNRCSSFDNMDDFRCAFGSVEDRFDRRRDLEAQRRRRFNFNRAEQTMRSNIAASVAAGHTRNSGRNWGSVSVACSQVISVSTEPRRNPQTKTCSRGEHCLSGGRRSSSPLVHYHRHFGGWNKECEAGDARNSPTPGRRPLIRRFSAAGSQHGTRLHYARVHLTL